jgi:hypothetical protein
MSLRQRRMSIFLLYRALRRIFGTRWVRSHLSKVKLSLDCVDTVGVNRHFRVLRVYRRHSSPVCRYEKAGLSRV